MKNILTIFKKELIGYLKSPMAYIVAASFFTITGFFFVASVSDAFSEASIRGFLAGAVFFMIFLSPALTMRLIAEEQKLGTMELLMTSPLKDFEMYLGENENYSTGEKFIITPEDIKYIRKMSYKKYANAENTYVLLESGDEVLNYKETATYFSGSYMDIVYGGSHSYESLDEKLKSIVNFIEIH